MEASNLTRRRWFRFSLRTMLVLVTLVCIYLSWAMNWIRQRQEFLTRMKGFNRILASEEETAPPWLLWPLREHGVLVLHILDNNSTLSTASEEERELATRLFPESALLDAPFY